jgi:hypothetical protein
MAYQNSTQYRKFVDEILDDVVMTSDKIIEYAFFEKTGQFQFTTIDGLIDFYPHSNKIFFRKKKKWELGGLKLLLDYVQGSKEVVFIIQDKNTMIIHGCFKTKSKAVRFINASDSFKILELGII